MLTKLTIRNFKRFGEIEVELGNPVVFVGPNNSGKTSAMQALALLDIGVKRWNERRAGWEEYDRGGHRNGAGRLLPPSGRCDFVQFSFGDVRAGISGSQLGDYRQIISCPGMATQTAVHSMLSSRNNA